MKSRIVILISVILLSSIIFPGLAIKETLEDENSVSKIIYNIETKDGGEITLTRYPGAKTPILLIPGMFENHLIFNHQHDNENAGLSAYLSKNNWDTWILDLRTHDADGDPKPSFIKEETKRKWDFDNTYLKEDLVKAVDYIKNETGTNSIFLLGHSMGGYLSYAYAERINQKGIRNYNF